MWVGIECGKRAPYYKLLHWEKRGDHYLIGSSLREKEEGNPNFTAERKRGGKKLSERMFGNSFHMI